MKSKLETIWDLKGGFELMDIGNSFFMIKFDAEDEKTRVINGGPWMIYDHYLAMRQWVPSFNASTATIDKTMVWIRIPSLNLVYYDESVLWAIASMVGNPIKVDLNTLTLARGRFARICVEIDLTQPVVGKVGVNGEWYHVQYEGLHVICTQCGCYGHVLKDCSISPKKIDQSNTPAENNSNGDKIHNDKAEGGRSELPKDLNEKNQFVGNDELNVRNHGDDGGADELHGDWIKVERKKRNPKINGYATTNAQKGMYNNLHKSQFIGNNGGEKAKASRVDMNNSSLINHSWVKKKSKRLRNENTGPKTNGTHVKDQNSILHATSVNKGELTIDKGQNSFNTHVGVGGKPTSNIKGTKPSGHSQNNTSSSHMEVAKIQLVELNQHVSSNGSGVDMNSHKIDNNVLSGASIPLNVVVNTEGDTDMSMDTSMILK
jgi:hypothetical protein